MKNERTRAEGRLSGDSMVRDGGAGERPSGERPRLWLIDEEIRPNAHTHTNTLGTAKPVTGSDNVQFHRLNSLL